VCFFCNQLHSPKEKKNCDPSDGVDNCDDAADNNGDTGDNDDDDYNDGDGGDGGDGGDNDNDNDENDSDGDGNDDATVGVTAGLQWHYNFVTVVLQLWYRLCPCHLGWPSQ
jgi:hypothetical protein